MPFTPTIDSICTPSSIDVAAKFQHRMTVSIRKFVKHRLVMPVDDRTCASFHTKVFGSSSAVWREANNTPKERKQHEGRGGPVLPG